MLTDIGVLADSIRYYHDADAFTAAHLYSVPHAGIYHCNAQYVVQRDETEALETCQVIFVDEGELAVEYRNRTQIAAAGTIVLLDFREPHKYYSLCENLRIRWFHLIGNSSHAYTQLILKTHGFVLHVAQNAEIEACCHTVLTMLHQKLPNPHMLSVTLDRLLVLLVLLLGKPEKSELERVIQRSADYIQTHYADSELTIAYLARSAALSTSYYLRKFRQYQSVTPHRFLQTARLRAAKQQLTTTSNSVEQIAERCGFCNTSHFIIVFRKDTGTTPLRFRTKWR